MISSMCITGVCGAPSKVSSAPSTPAAFSSASSSGLRWYGTSASAVPWMKSVGGQRGFTLAKRRASGRGRPPQADRRADAVAACVHRRRRIVTQVVHDHPAGRAARQRDAPRDPSDRRRRWRAPNPAPAAHRPPHRAPPRANPALDQRARDSRPRRRHSRERRTPSPDARCSDCRLSLPGRKPPPCSQRITGRKACASSSGR